MRGRSPVPVDPRGIKRTPSRSIGEAPETRTRVDETTAFQEKCCHEVSLSSPSEMPYTVLEA
eukprot:4318893-Amphidinium_carterae.1